LDGIQNLQESLPMTVRLKRVEDQVIVLTGASSGIGLATAHAAAARGARLVLVSRNDAALQQAARECNDMGGRAIAVVADVARREDLEHVARVAVETFGGFDTWINNAGLSVYGTLERIPLEDHRRLIDVNYWGVVHGSLIAARHLRARGGAIINTGSVISDRAVPLQGPYSASKFAVKAFTDTLRMELEHDGAPVSVTLIKPSAIDTPFFEHARTYLDTPACGTRRPPTTRASSPRPCCTPARTRSGASPSAPAAPSSASWAGSRRASPTSPWSRSPSRCRNRTSPAAARAATISMRRARTAPSARPSPAARARRASISSRNCILSPLWPCSAASASPSG
jgi:NAD(P)-dependent dehydrogenase (short-subunit alcohol dehydrogenase family)